MITIEDARARSQKGMYQHPMAYLLYFEEEILECARDGLTEASTLISDRDVESLTHLMKIRGFTKTKVVPLNNGWGTVMFTVYWDKEDAA